MVTLHDRETFLILALVKPSGHHNMKNHHSTLLNTSATSTRGKTSTQRGNLYNDLGIPSSTSITSLHHKQFGCLINGIRLDDYFHLSLKTRGERSQFSPEIFIYLFNCMVDSPAQYTWSRWLINCLCHWPVFYCPGQYTTRQSVSAIIVNYRLHECWTQLNHWPITCHFHIISRM